MKLMQKTMLAALFLAGVLSSVSAVAVTYDYIGNAFNRFAAIDPITNDVEPTDTLPANVGPRITGSATFADGIDNPVTSYILTDGQNTLDNTMPGVRFFNMTFENNDVNTWRIGLARTVNNVSLSLFTIFDGNLIIEDQSTYLILNNDSLAADDFANILGSPGTWTLRDEQVSEVPVPAALPLMASALGLFGLARSRKQFV